MTIHFVFIGEGSSDEGLMPHLANLCIDAGATEVTWAELDFRRLPGSLGHTVEAKINAALVYEPNANLIFVHRDADARCGSDRHREIASAAAACGCARLLVGVVPVQETEAWLLLDEGAIRQVVGRPRGAAPLGLPSPRAVERLARPKERLKAILETASEASGRRLDRVRRDFPVHRRALLQDLPITGPIEQVPSWQRLRDDLRDAIVRILARP